MDMLQLILVQKHNDNKATVTLFLDSETNVDKGQPRTD
jgi:hypothetical protein